MRLKLIKLLRNHYLDSLYRNSYYILATSIISSLLGLAFWIIAARSYSVSDTGLAVALISASGLIISISKFGLDVSIIRFLGRETHKATLINTCLTVTGIATLAISILFILGTDIWANKLNFIRDSAFYTLSFIIFTCLFGMFIIQSNVFIALRNAKYSFLHNIIVVGLRIPLAIFMASFFASFGIFGSWGISLCIGMFISMFFFSRVAVSGYSPYPIIHGQMVKEIANFSASNYVVNFFSGAPALLIPLLVLQLLSPEESAYFYLTYSIANILFMIPGAFSVSLFAEGSNNEESIIPNLKKAIRHSYIFLIPSVLMIILFGNVFLLLFGKGYSSNGHLLLALLAISGLFITLNSFYFMYLRLRLQMKKVILITIVTTLSIIGLTQVTLSILGMGLSGVGIAYLLVNGIMSVYVIIQFWRMSSSQNSPDQDRTCQVYQPEE